MRILHILDHSLPLQSGYVYRTLGIINEQRALGWEPILLTSGKHTLPGPPRERIGDWEFFRSPRPNGFLAQMPVAGELKIVRDLGHRLDEVVRETRPDILHAHSPVLNALPAFRMARRYGLPLVYEVRAFWEDARISSTSGAKRGLRYHGTRLLETRALRRADAVITICRGLAEDVIERGVPPNKVTIVPNAVDRQIFTGPGEPDRHLAGRLGLLDKTVLGFFGSFYFYEGLHLLLEALPELRRRRPDMAVLLVGGGPEEARLRDLARRLDLGQNAVFAGRIAHKEIRRYYDLTDIFVFPRLSMRLTELVTPLKPLEAMAQERIVAASNVGGHRELIRDRETGYLFPPDSSDGLTEGVLAALDDRASWPRIRARAIEYVDSERSWKHSVSRYADVYGRVLRR